jgi:hypothetical protein
MKESPEEPFKITHSLWRAKYSIRCENGDTDKLAEIISDYFEKKGAPLKEESAKLKIFKPLISFSWDPLSRSPDNWIGLNPVLLFGTVLMEKRSGCIEISMKSPRPHYFSGFMFLSCLWGYFDSERDPFFLIAGLIFSSFIELMFLALKSGLKTELVKALSGQKPKENKSLFPSLYR